RARAGTRRSSRAPAPRRPRRGEDVHRLRHSPRQRRLRARVALHAPTDDRRRDEAARRRLPRALNASFSSPRTIPRSTAMKLDDRIAIVTGAASGIGLATARRLAEAGATVMLGDIDDARGEQAAADLRAAGLRADYAHCNVTDDASVAAF